MLLLILLSYTVTTVGGLIVLKLSANKGQSFLKVKNGKMACTLTPLTTLGACLYVISFFLYVYLVSKYDLGFIIPLAAALVYTTLFTVSYYLLGEVFTPRKTLSLSMMITGIVLLGIHG